MKVKFLPQNIELEIQPDQTLKDLCDNNGIFVKSICNGVPACAECRVKIIEGEHNVLPPGIKELSLIGTGHFIDFRRLSCQVKCFGDITVDITEQVEKQKQLGQKRPQGSKKDEAQPTHAVGGNLLEQENVLSQTLDEVKRENRPQQNQNHQQQRSQQKNHSRNGDARSHGQGRGRRPR